MRELAPLRGETEQGPGPAQARGLGQGREPEEGPRREAPGLELDSDLGLGWASVLESLREESLREESLREESLREAPDSGSGSGSE